MIATPDPLVNSSLQQARRRIPCPPPGVYRGVPAAEYHAWDAASNSALNRLARSPMHARWELDNPSPPTEATLRGDALHLAVLEPQLFSERYVVAGQCSAVLQTGVRRGEECGAPGKAVHGGRWMCGSHSVGIGEDVRTVLPAAVYRACVSMHAAAVAHPDVAALLAATDDRELSIVFDWPETQVRCKARIDVPALAAGVLGDLKTTQDASEGAFMRSIVRYGYHRQAPFYLTGCRELHSLGLLPSAPTDFLFIPVEADPPHGVGVYRLSDGAVSAGRESLQRLIPQWALCTARGMWPGYAQEIRDITLPDWAWNHA